MQPLALSLSLSLSLRLSPFLVACAEVKLLAVGGDSDRAETESGEPGACVETTDLDGGMSWIHFHCRWVHDNPEPPGLRIFTLRFADYHVSRQTIFRSSCQYDNLDMSQPYTYNHDIFTAEQAGRPPGEMAGHPFKPVNARPPDSIWELPNGVIYILQQAAHDLGELDSSLDEGIMILKNDEQAIQADRENALVRQLANPISL